jgi:FXSXX-COOH protein
MGEDVTDCALIDVRDMDLEELLSDGHESALTKALYRILEAGSNRANSFNSSI